MEEELLKDTYTREEVIEIIKSYDKSFVLDDNRFRKEKWEDLKTNWIKENL